MIRSRISNVKSASVYNPVHLDVNLVISDKWTDTDRDITKSRRDLQRSENWPRNKVEDLD
jgi:hypothetical protein